MSDAESLKPCPFCGGEAEEIEERNLSCDCGCSVYAIQCRSCGASTPFSGPADGGEPDAHRTVWNCRANEESTDE